MTIEEEAIQQEKRLALIDAYYAAEDPSEKEKISNELKKEFKIILR